MSKGKFGPARPISTRVPNVRIMLYEREIEDLKSRSKRGNAKASSTLISKAAVKRSKFLS